MPYKLEVYSAFCSTSLFEINGIPAYKDDFGHQGDENPEDAEEYGCGNMTFTPIDPTPEVLAKYKITEDDYWAIALHLENELSFGNCGMCV